MASKNEHTSERVSRLRREDADARVKRWEKLMPLSLKTLLVLCVVVYFFLTLFGGYDPEERQRAWQLFQGLLMGLGLASSIRNDQSHGG